MRAAVYVLQLMATQFGHHDTVFAEVVEDIEQRYADITCQDGAWQQMVYQRGRGALAFGAGDADGEVAVDLEEEVGEGG
jgi:hypothetical protein